MSQGSRRTVGVILLASASVFLLCAALIWIGTIPLDPGVRTLVGGALAVAALLDLAIGLKLFQSSG